MAGLSLSLCECQSESVVPGGGVGVVLSDNAVLVLPAKNH